MMRPVLINEKNISLTRKCNHHCDVELINKAGIYENECKEYRDCTYVSENTTICSVVSDKTTADLNYTLKKLL